MNYEDLYLSKRVSMEQALSLIGSGDRIYTQVGVSMPCALIEGLYDIKDRVHDVTVELGITKRDFRIFGKECNGHINVRSYFLYPGERKAIAAGSRIQIVPTDMHHIERKRDESDYDTAMICVSPMDENGYMSLGMNCNDIPDNRSKYHRIIAQVNSELPYVYGEQNRIHISDITCLVEHSEPLQELPVSAGDKKDDIIAEYIAELIEDGSTLQFGVGGPGMLVGKKLKSKKDLGIHTECFCDTMLELIECGAVNNSKKTLLPGINVFAFCQGLRSTYAVLDHNPEFECRPFGWVNDPTIIERNIKMISINSALAVDLFGQVCAESIGTRHYSGSGGNCDFVRGAQMSPGGKSFIAMQSTYTKKDGSTGSKIDLTLPLGSIVTTRRNDVQYIATEYGVVNLRNNSIEERAAKLISIAHPDFRDKLMFDAKANGLIV